jgi:hypothetical protein
LGVELPPLFLLGVRSPLAVPGISTWLVLRRPIIHFLRVVRLGIVDISHLTEVIRPAAGLVIRYSVSAKCSTLVPRCFFSRVARLAGEVRASHARHRHRSQGGPVTHTVLLVARSLLQPCAGVSNGPALGTPLWARLVTGLGSSVGISPSLRGPIALPRHAGKGPPLLGLSGQSAMVSHPPSAGRGPGATRSGAHHASLSFFVNWDCL